MSEERLIDAALALYNPEDARVAVFCLTLALILAVLGIALGRNWLRRWLDLESLAERYFGEEHRIVIALFYPVVIAPLGFQAMRYLDSYADRRLSYGNEHADQERMGPRTSPSL